MKGDYNEYEKGFIDGLQFGFKITKEQYEFALESYEKICKTVKNHKLKVKGVGQHNGTEKADL